MNFFDLIRDILKENDQGLTVEEIVKELEKTLVPERLPSGFITNWLIQSKIHAFPFHFTEKGGKIELSESGYKKLQELESLLSGIMNETRDFLYLSDSKMFAISIIFFKRIVQLYTSEDLDYPPKLMGEADLMFIKGRLNKAPKEVLTLISYFESEYPILEGSFLKLKEFFQQYSETEFRKVLLDVWRFDLSRQKYSIPEFGYFIRSSIERFFGGDNKEFGASSTSVSQLIAELAAPSALHIVTDPVSGTGNTLLASLALTPQEDRFKGYLYTGQDFSPPMIWLSKINLFSNGYYHTKILEGNSLRQSNLLPDRSDIVIADIPIYGNKKPKDEDFSLSYGKPFPDYNGLFLQMMLNLVNQEGKIVTTIPTSFLSRTSKNHKVFRKGLIKEDLVEAVVALPRGINGNYSSPFSILILNKAKPSSRKNIIQFINATHYIIDPKTGIDDIQIANIVHAYQKGGSGASPLLKGYDKSLDISDPKFGNMHYSLLPGLFADPVLEEIDNFSPQAVRLKEILTKTKTVQYKADDPGLGTDIPYVTVKNLANSEIEYELDLPEDYASHYTRGLIVRESALLVSRVGPELKPTYFRFTGTPIVINSNVMAFSIPKEGIDVEKIDVEYLIFELQSEIAQKQLAQISRRAAIPNINPKDFLGIMLEVPSMEEQKKRVVDHKNELLHLRESELEELRKKLRLAERSSYEEVESKQNEIISAIQHELGNKLPAIRLDLQTLRSFLSGKEASEAAFHFQESIRPSLEGEEEEEVDTVEEVFQRMRDYVEYSISMVDGAENIIKMDIRNLRKQKQSIIKLLNQQKRKFARTKNLKINILQSEEEIGKFEFDADQIGAAITNLIENALRHGVKNDEKLTIIFALKKNVDNGSISILCKNDGAPFPENFTFKDFIKFRGYAGKTGNSGIGGFLINKVIENHGGTFQMIEDVPEEDPYKVQFELHFPLSNTTEE